MAPRKKQAPAARKSKYAIQDESSDDEQEVQGSSQPKGTTQISTRGPSYPPQATISKSVPTVEVTSSHSEGGYNISSTKESGSQSENGDESGDEGESGKQGEQSK